VGIGKLHSRTGHVGPEWGQKCSSTPSLTSGPDGAGGKRNAASALRQGMTRYAMWTSVPIWTGTENLAP